MPPGDEQVFSATLALAGRVVRRVRYRCLDLGSERRDAWAAEPLNREGGGPRRL